MSSVAMPTTGGGARAVPNVYEESSMREKPIVGGSMNYKCEYL